ncbi:hypothetical protein Bca52824_028606 [Brassica carinata]|uniref:Uncharacterized protein n=1 Tax=Brassica carinata TaxID=52824 RepID=A0A8X8AQB0_BRACI|nr:hypothetical protein Bca52824_028606 [Brassica carinata]
MAMICSDKPSKRESSDDTVRSNKIVETILVVEKLEVLVEFILTMLCGPIYLLNQQMTSYDRFKSDFGESDKEESTTTVTHVVDEGASSLIEPQAPVSSV